MSGDMNTALGNCIIVSAIYYAYMRHHKIKCSFIDNGDDCGVIVEKSNLGQLAGVGQWFRDFGFRLEIEEPVFVLEELVFCQMQPVWTVNGYVMVRQLAKALEKDTMTIIKMDSDKMVRKWMYSVGECGLALCSGIPVMQAFYSAYMRNGLPSNMSTATYMECGARHLSKRMESVQSQILDDTRYSFYLAFGITPCSQEDLEEKYFNWKYVHGVDSAPLQLVPQLVDARIDQNEESTI